MLTDRDAERFGRALTWFLLGALVGWTIPCWGQGESLFVHAPPPKPIPHVIPVLIVAQPIRDSLAKLWNDTDPDQVERGYCVAWHGAVFLPEKIVVLRLDSLVRPDTVLRANGYSVTYRCRPKTIPLHTHAPTTCEGGPPIRGAAPPICTLGGINAYECFGSPADVKSLEYMELPFGIVQCDKFALVPFFPRPPEAR